LGKRKLYELQKQVLMKKKDFGSINLFDVESM
jgi:hypothetical protein